MFISGMKGQGWRAIPTQYRKASNILTSTLAAFYSAATRKGKGIERLIITLALTTGRDNRETTSHHTTKINQIQHKSITIELDR